MGRPQKMQNPDLRGPMTWLCSLLDVCCVHGVHVRHAHLTLPLRDVLDPAISREYCLLTGENCDWRCLIFACVPQKLN